MGFIKLECPGCGSPMELDDSREFGFCQYCGTKVVQDKIIVEHKIDHSEEIKKLYEGARNAKKISNYESALKQYQELSSKDPDNWEPLFYTVIMKAYETRRFDIAEIPYDIINSLNTTFSLVKENVIGEIKIQSVIDEIISECTKATNLLIKALSRDDNINRTNAVRILAECGNSIEAIFDMEKDEYKNYAVYCWKKALEFKPSVGSASLDLNTKIEVRKKLLNYDPSYTNKSEELFEKIYGTNALDTAKNKAKGENVSNKELRKSLIKGLMSGKKGKIIKSILIGYGIFMLIIFIGCLIEILGM